MTATATTYRAKHRGRWSPTDYLGSGDYVARHSVEAARVRAEMRRELLDFIHADDGRDCGRAL